jgi:hypothetical protein
MHDGFGRLVVLGTPAALLVPAMWSVGVGAACLSIRQRASRMLGVGALMAAASIVIVLPGVTWGVVLGTIGMSATAAAGSLLVSADNHVTRRRAALVLVLTSLAFGIDAGSPRGYEWLEWALLPFIVCGVGVGAFLLLAPSLRGRRWYAGVCACAMFSVVSVWWMARQYYLEGRDARDGLQIILR